MESKEILKSSLAPKSERAIACLCRRHRNEERHTRHVTALALEIFDAVSARFDLPSRDRALLEAAARLHDIGYGGSPRAHVRAGASLVARARLPGFSSAEHSLIGGVILLHAKSHERILDHALFRGPLRRAALRAQAFRLGSILRVADGLDHGHVQDARIRAISIVRGSPGAVRLLVESPAWPGNIAWAVEKSDLWNQVFPFPLRIKLKAVSAKRMFGPVVDGDAPILESCRRLLFVLFRVIGEEWEAALREDEPRHCHDLRVAIRRFRTLLRLFRPSLVKTAASRMRRELGLLADLLGPPRDADVWLRTLAAVAPSSADSAVAAILSSARAERVAGLSAMRAALIQADEDGLRRRITTFLRVTMHEIAASACVADAVGVADPPRAENRVPASSLAARLLLRAVKRARKGGAWKEEPSAESLHEYRRIVRRGRYTAEFFSPILGRPADDLARRFKVMADALGDHHDASVGVDRLMRTGQVSDEIAGSGGLQRGLAKMSAAAWREFQKERSRLDRLSLRDLRREGRREGGGNDTSRRRLEDEKKRRKKLASRAVSEE